MTLDHSKNQAGLVKPTVVAERDGYGTAWLRHTAGHIRGIVVMVWLALW
jgi:hypothetical protein